MNQKMVLSSIQKIFYGAIVWALFYLFVFYDKNAWNDTLFGKIFVNSYKVEWVYLIMILFFLLLNVNLYQNTIGKKTNTFTLQKFLNVFITAIAFIVLTQSILIQLKLPFHFGFLGYFMSSASYIHNIPNGQPTLFILYIFSITLQTTYILGIIIFIFQLYKIKMRIPFMIKIRLFIVLFLYVMILGHTQNSQMDFMLLGMTLLYMGFAFIVYMKSSYSLKALFLVIILLFLI